ncbi:hypothetical protein PV328_009233 [Microctonus aethiopoides]|uniref:Mitochondrial ribonuclease P catalytic subunit n=1 Tax=Microctonus aethiopoides TaxID=144406 RepID=A0AA39C5D1_9HYME|nr:hypothetical protein PV328_009233 [Microctonus aethiopoides]
MVNLRFIRFFCTERPYPLKSTKPCYIKHQENLMLNHLLQTNQIIDNDKWVEIRKELRNSEFAFTEHNVDSAIMDLCCDFSNKLAAKNYVEFLRNTNHELNIATIGRYFKILFTSETPLSAEETKAVFELYDKLRAKYPILDTRTTESCILVLSKTSRWKECFDLLEMIQSDGLVGTNAYASIITAAFNNDDAETGWKCLKQLQPRTKLPNFLLESYLNHCTRCATDSKELAIQITKMFEFWSDYDFYPEQEIIEMYMKCLKDTKEWITRKTSIKHNGTCPACGYKLSSLQVSSDDFENLAKSFLYKVLVGNDVYNNTTPKELQEFKKFVDATKPYDVVIDGLNTAYAVKNGKGAHNPARELANVLKTFVAENKKTFIFGRKHMLKWSQREMNYIKQHSYIFLANDTSEDDPFMLYATFTSGMNTFFVSRDLMRRHKFILNDEYLRRTFRHWQLTRQIQPKYIGVPFNKQLVLIHPPAFLPIAQQNRNGDWHIPYNEETSYKELQLTNRPSQWLCFKKIKS